MQRVMKVARTHGAMGERLKKMDHPHFFDGAEALAFLAAKERMRRAGLRESLGRGRSAAAEGRGRDRCSAAGLSIPDANATASVGVNANPYASALCAGAGPSGAALAEPPRLQRLYSAPIPVGTAAESYNEHPVPAPRTLRAAAEDVVARSLDASDEFSDSDNEDADDDEEDDDFDDSDSDSEDDDSEAEGAGCGAAIVEPMAVFPMDAAVARRP